MILTFPRLNLDIDIGAWVLIGQVSWRENID
jgi:hypothetical protein